MIPDNRNAHDRGRPEPARTRVAPPGESEQAEPLAPSHMVLSPSAHDYVATEREPEPWEQIVDLNDWPDFKAQHHLEVVSIDWPAWAALPVVAVMSKRESISSEEL